MSLIYWAVHRARKERRTFDTEELLIAFCKQNVGWMPIAQDSVTLRELRWDGSE